MTGPDGSSTQRIDLLSELIGVSSVNPLQAGPRSGPGGEAAMAAWMADQTERAGAAEVAVDEVEPGRPNVYAHFPAAPVARRSVSTSTSTRSVWST